MAKGVKIIISFSIITLTLSGCSTKFYHNKDTNQPKNNSQQNSQAVNQNNASLGASSSILEQLAKQDDIKKFLNADELKDYLENNATNPTNSYMARNDILWGGAETKSVSNLSLEAPTAQTEQQATGLGSRSSQQDVGSSDYSKTNIQVEGVDEADIIKTDGKYIYAVVKNSLYIIDAYPPDKSEIVSKIEFKSRPEDVYLNGNSLIIFGADDKISEMPVYKTFHRHNPYTFFKVFDISDKKTPKQVRDLDFEGNYTDSRMIGDYAYFVTTNYNYYYQDIEPIMPRVLDGGVVMETKCASDDTKCFSPEIYYFDMPYNQYNFVTITAINTKDNSEKINGNIYLMSSNENMYVSESNIYISYTKYISEYQLLMDVVKTIVYPLLSEKDRSKISKIEATENFILSPEEKMSKINVIVERYKASLSDQEQNDLQQKSKEELKKKYEDISKELEKTVIHKIAIDKNNITYKVSGEVTGQVLNQFSMDEASGYFRIATTKNQTWSMISGDDSGVQKSYNNLYVLDDNLKITGRLENLAEGEKIYSVRFMQNRAYMVTFQQTDPLFVIDLTDNNNPKVLGKLKIPGFSSYLHPYNDKLLIGLGKETTENKWGGVTTKGIKLSLFDVSDVNNPKEVNTYTMGDAGSDSIALNDHKAFLFSKDKNLLVIPVSVMEKNGTENQFGYTPNKLTFSGAAVFAVNEEGFKLKGKIDHSDGGQATDVDYWGGYNYYDNTVKRSLYIDDTLYTFSNNYLKMNKLENLETVKNLKLQKEKKNDYEIVN